MKLNDSINETRRQIALWRTQGCSIGFVATMGYLHAGHRSLIEQSVAHNDKTVVSIFVNPTQFGANEDLSSYPRDLERDMQLCQEAGADLIFNPQPEQMYPEPAAVSVTVTGLSDRLCGQSRPGHFQGVVTVVTKLFNIITPDRAYFGQKDAQQLAIIKKMVKDLDFPIEIIGCPIVREPDGLALSSRNTYLSPDQRQEALVLFESLQLARSLIVKGERDAAKIEVAIGATITAKKLCTIDYVAIVSAATLDKLTTIHGDTLIALAVKVGTTRLIDNIVVEAGEVPQS